MRNHVRMSLLPIACTSVQHQMSHHRSCRRNLMPIQEGKKAFDLGPFLGRVRLKKLDRKLIEVSPSRVRGPDSGSWGRDSTSCKSFIVMFFKLSQETVQQDPAMTITMPCGGGRCPVPYSYGIRHPSLCAPRPTKPET